jgi:AcrR family transcriptional regulator
MMNASETRALFDRLLGSVENADDPYQQRRMQILQAATELFVAQGYKKTSITEVAERANVTKPTVYAHYKSKAHLLLHAIANEKRSYFDRMVPVLDPAVPPRLRLLRLIETTLILANEMPLTAQILRGERDVVFALEELDEMRELVRDGVMKREALRTFFYEELLEAIAPERLDAKFRRERAQVLVALSFCAGVFADDKLHPGMSYDRFARVLSTMLAGGVDEPEPLNG